MKIQPKKVDLLKLQLNAEQGFVLSRLTGPMTLEELAGQSGLTEEKLLRALEALAREGAIEVDPPFATDESAPTPTSERATPTSERATPTSERAPPSSRGRAAAAPAPSAGRLEAAAPASASGRASSAPSRPSAVPGVVRPPLPGTGKRAPSALPPQPSATHAARPSAPVPLPRPVPQARPSAPVALGPAEMLDFNLDMPAPTPAVQPPPSSSPGPAAAPASGTTELSRDVSATGPSLTIYGRTDVGVVRTNNEDAFAVIDLEGGVVVEVTQQAAVEGSPRGVALVVSDGMGGENAGEVASAIVIEAVREHLHGSFDPTDPADSLRRALDHANAKVQAGAQEPGREGMGATVIALHVSGTTAYTAEIGDSRAYLFRQGKLHLMSKDQTQVQLLLDQGLLTPDAVKTSRAKNVVLQAIGKLPELVVAQRRLELRRGDRLLLCSDGLTGHVTDAEIAGFLWGDRLDEACDEMIEKAKERGGKDNITVIVAEVDGPAPSAAAGETVEQTLTTLRAFEVG